MDLKCPLCMYSSDSIALMHVHCVSAHPKEFFTCPWCTLPFSTLRVLQKHATSCPSFDKNAPREGDIDTVLVCGEKCLVCEGRFASNEATIQHYKEQHLNFSYICDVCELYFQHNANLNVHYASCHNTTCTSNPSAHTDGNLIQNKKRTAETAFNGTDDRGMIGFAGPSKVGPPTSGGKRVEATTYSSAKTQLTANKRQLMKYARKLRCLDCAIHFSNKLKIKIHFDVVHRLQMYFCDDCHNVYTLRSNLCRHAKRCNANRNNHENVPAIAMPAETQHSAVDVSVVVNQKIFACHLCGFETETREVIAAHQISEHVQPTADRVKLEMGAREINVTSSSTIANVFKQESNEDWINMNNGQRPEPTYAGSFDLTLDDD